MALLTNPVLVSVLVLCVLCLCKLNVLMSLIIASMVGALMGGIGLAINLVQERLNPDLKIEGVVFTMYDVRTNLSNQVVETVKENLDAKIYSTMIPRNIRLAEAPSYGIPINMYDTKSAGAESYRNLAKEIIEREDL